jgi:phosphohistidine phosphatase SixA
MERLLVGRHATVGDGIEEAHSMADWLRQKDITPRAIILSSIAQRAIQTASIIRLDLQLPTLVTSELLYGAGQHPEIVRDLGHLTEDVLDALDIDHQGQDVAMISHLPLVQAIADRSVEPGRMYEVPNGWVNQLFDADLEQILTHRPDLW